MTKWYKELDKKFSWSFFGFLIGILGFGFGLFTYLHHEKPQMQFEVITNTDIINVKENIGKIQILYDKENVLSYDTTLKIVTVKFVNSGNISIKKDYYDFDYPIGLKITGCKIVDKPVAIEYSNSYLKDRFTFEYDSTSIRINPIIMDKGDFVTIKLILIGAKIIPVNLTSFGKIAEQTSIPVITENEKPIKLSLFAKLTAGSIGIHFARFFLYIFFAALAMILIFLPISEISDKLTEKSKFKKIKKFKALYDLRNDSHYELIFNLYIEYDIEIFDKIIQLSNDKDRLASFLHVDYNLKKLLPSDLSFFGLPLDNEAITNFKSKTFLDTLMLEKDIIIKEDQKAHINGEFIDKMNKFINFIKL